MSLLSKRIESHLKLTNKQFKKEIEKYQRIINSAICDRTPQALKTWIKLLNYDIENRQQEFLSYSRMHDELKQVLELLKDDGSEEPMFQLELIMLSINVNNLYDCVMDISAEQKDILKEVFRQP